MIMLPNLANKNRMSSEVCLSDSSEEYFRTCTSHGISRRLWISVVGKGILGVSTSIVDLVGEQIKLLQKV